MSFEFPQITAPEPKYGNKARAINSVTAGIAGIVLFVIGSQTNLVVLDVIGFATLICAALYLLSACAAKRENQD